jgi:protoheme IX farnesyltransferase
MSLVVFTGLVGMAVAPVDVHPVLAIAALLSIALGAGASGAINMWYDADIDAVMDRTKDRPIPSGKVSASEALTLGVVVSGGAVMVMGLANNYLAAGLLLLTIGFYVFVYTMWLKRRTPQNIVIGGAAGAMPPLIGWAAVTGEISLFPILMFAIIFIWTPPLLPVTAGSAKTRLQILLYSLVLAATGIVPWALSLTGDLYGFGAAALGFIFAALAFGLFRKGAAEEADGSHLSAKRLFRFSLLYLFLMFTLLLVDGLMGVPVWW